ncbi:atp3 gamma subunit of the F1 sector of mitochondrial F1F0 ATP synthase [Mortierella alpina]|uniref:Atp3 gamma subunit of the F1 sector of mitochondrial F1F0 ATP synthase n=1 Tax=Mortierella alpina TaxID=64518 RepID=A0A9P6M6L8_MORAP|nr:atp3 gamma subunit of the F1 sector of mitochondrial F1F0 ATP synthase [Mortierella alpina]
MATLREIQLRLNSIKNIGKITKSMKMIASTKVAKSQKAMESARVYGNTSSSIYENAKTAPLENENNVYIVSSSDRGLCGGIHSSVAKATRRLIAASPAGTPTSVIVLGDKAKNQMSRSNQGFAAYELDDDVLSNYNEFLLANNIYWALVEGHASEMSAKRTAMENATKNAGEMVDRLTMTYNRTRQAAITSELVDIITGQSSDPKVQRLMFPWTGTQGPIINGKLIINHREDITLKGLTLNFKAKIMCSWHEKRGNSTVYYSAKKPLLEKTWVFLEKSDSKLHMLRANQTYSYDFQLALPVNLPNSLHMSTGKIEYMFSANGKRSTFQLDLDRDRLIEIYQSLPPSHPHCIYPLQLTADFEQALNYLVQIPRKAYHHGSAIPITVRMHPLPGLGARWRVKEMNMKIKEYFWFISPGKGMKHEKRSLVEAKLGKDSWPVETGALEKSLSITLPAVNVMSTVDTEIIKCTHKLKILFSLEVNGSSKKLAADFDIYIPGPFPPGQGPAAMAPQHQQHPQHQPYQQQQQLPPYAQHQQIQYQQPLPPVPVQPQYQQPLPQPPPHAPYQQPYVTYPHQQPPLAHAAPLPSIPPQQYAAHQPYTPQQPYTPKPFASPAPSTPTTQQHPGMSPSSYAPSVQMPSTGYSQPSAHNPFSPPQTPLHTQSMPYPVPPGAPVSTPGMAPAATSMPAPHLYSQGYPTPTASHSYPVATSSQGYPTPAMPPMPSPTAGHNYPMPPSPGLAQQPMAQAASPHNIPMPVPSPTPASSQLPAVAPSASHTSPASHPKTPVISYQQHQFTAPPMPPVSNKVDSPKPINVDDGIKVNLDDIKIPSTPSTPASTTAGVTATATNHSKNPQQRNSYVAPPPVNGVDAHLAYQSPLSGLPQNPQALKEPGTDMHNTTNQFSYQPPPSSVPLSSTTTTLSMPPPTTTSTTSATTQHVNPYATAAAAAIQQKDHDLTHQFSQMGVTQGVNGGYSGGAVASPSTSHTQPPTPAPASSQVPSPSVRPNLSHAHSISYSNPMSPVTAAATGAVMASQQQHQQQLQQQQQQQPIHHQYVQQQQQQQQPQQPQKQQVWIPMYQTLAGKTYVQYVLSP